MMKKMKFGCWLFCLILFTMACSAQKRAAGPDPVKVDAYYTVAPLLKGMDINSLIQIRVAVPAGNHGLPLSFLQGRLNKEGLDAVEKLEVYYTAGERKMLKDSLVTTIIPQTVNVQFPLPLKLAPGIHYFWVNAILKPGADLDKKVAFNVSTITSAPGKVYQVSNGTVANNKPVGIAIRKAWDDSVHTYRIPGMATTDKGTLIAVYDIRYKHSGDLPANIDVGMSRSTDGGNTWEPMKIIMDMGAPHENNGIGDPAVLFDPITKKIWVAALWSKGNNSIRDSRPGLSADSSGQFVLVSSADDGLTWSEPYNITSQVKNPKWHIYFNGPGNGIAMQNGTLVFPSQYWDESKKPGIPHSAIIYSEDQGKTWKSGTGAKWNTTEAQVVETTPGTLMLNMRDNRGSFRSVATTIDLGKSWTEHHTSYNALPDPVCMAGFIKAKVRVKGELQEVLFFSNVNSQTARKDMTIKASLDLGETWLPANELLLDQRRSYGYSALTKIDDNTIGILYEGERNLYFLRVPVKEIVK